MSQTSPTPKAEPEAAASGTTPATQTPTTSSYTPGSWASSRSYQHTPRPRIVISRKQSYQKYPSTLSCSNSLQMPRRSGVYVLVFCSHSVLGRSITHNSNIPITHKRHMATISPIFHPRRPHKLRLPGSQYSVSLRRQQANSTRQMLLPSMTR
jgi:hypothetical protein